MIITVILIILLFSLVAIIFVGNRRSENRFHKKINDLFSHANIIADKKFSYDQIQKLPQPVQRYFRHVLKEGQPYITSVRLTHGGRFKNGLKSTWMDIKGEEYFTTDKPGYVWRGKTFLFTAIDSYVLNKGRLTAHLFNLLKVADGSGEKYDQGELLRWLGESVCFPTNLLPNEHLQWLPVNDHSAKLNFQYHGISISYIVFFNERNEICSMETQRYMENNRLEKWINHLTNYKEIDGILIPTGLEAGWQFTDGYFSYASFHIRTLEFNIYFARGKSVSCSNINCH